MLTIDPIPDFPAATAQIEDLRFLLVADYHAGFEAGARYEAGMELTSRAPERRNRLIGLIEDHSPDELIVLGDLTHSIGKPGTAERAELELLFDELTLPVTIAKGNHDGVLEDLLDGDVRYANVKMVSSHGGRIGPLGFVHGHTWPSPDVLEARVVCIGHEHPCVRLIDEVGGSRIERVWIRGELVQSVFSEQLGVAVNTVPELIVFPAFNDLSGGTWINIPGQQFLSPFLPAGLTNASVYLLDGTLLGPFVSQ